MCKSTPWTRQIRVRKSCRYMYLFLCQGLCQWRICGQVLRALLRITSTKSPWQLSRFPSPAGPRYRMVRNGHFYSFYLSVFKKFKKIAHGVTSNLENRLAFFLDVGNGQKIFFFHEPALRDCLTKTKGYHSLHKSIGLYKGTVSRDYNCLNVVSLDRS